MGKIVNLEKINPLKRDIISDILAKVNDDEYLEKMIIFGSSTRNDCRADSDIDIALEWAEDCYDEDGVLRTFTLPVYRVISTVTKGNNDVVCVGYEGELIKDAVRKGVVVYERNHV